MRNIELEYDVDTDPYPTYVWIRGERYITNSEPYIQYNASYGRYQEYHLSMRLIHYPLQEPPKPPMRRRRTALSLGLRRPE